MLNPEQIAAMQRQIALDAEKMGMTVPQFIGESALACPDRLLLTAPISEHLKRQAAEQMQAQQQQGQQGQGQHQHQHQQQHQHQHQHPQQGQPQPIVPGPPNPVALALAKFLRGQNLKPRTCILNGERKDMFRVS